MDPDIWISYKVIFNTAAVDLVSHLQLKILRSSLVDTEKTYTGLTDGCAAAGRAGCKLIEFTGNGVSGKDVKDLITCTHDVMRSLPIPLIGGLNVYIRWLSSSIALDTKFLLTQDS